MTPFETSKWHIYRGEYWSVILHRNQSYLGRAIVYLHRVLEDPLKVTKEEHKELWFYIIPRLKTALEKSFHPDRINYSHLANKDHFVHWHIVPRYENDVKREFAGEVFTDDRPFKNFAPDPDKFLTDEKMQQVLDEVRRNF